MTVKPSLRQLPPSLCAALALASACAQSRPALPPLPAPQSVPAAAAAGNGPYAPQTLLQGGIVVPLYPAGSPILKADRVKEPEKYTMSRVVPGRVSSIVNVHNPSIEFHPVEKSLNTGAVIILAPGGGHRTLVVGGEGTDPVPFFYNYGINTVILRYRLRVDGYVAEKDAVDDALQAIRMVRAYAKEWNLDPNKIGIMGFSAGAELAAPAAIRYDEFDKAHNDPSDPFAGITSRPDFTALIYPGPTPFARGGTPAVPKNVPPAWITCAGSGDRVHAIWAMEYYNAMLALGVPNIEMVLYGNGVHGGSLTNRNGIPFGTWQYRFLDWARDLGFLEKPGIETKAARDVAKYVSEPLPRSFGPRPAGARAPVPAPK